jgi:intracellular sulfur oxidation DsrE/DsrF family protein
MYDVLIHIDDADEYRINIVLNNANNILSDLDNVKVEIVANARGYKLFIQDNNPYYDRLKELKSMGVKLVLCNNTLKGVGLKKDDLIEGVELVPSGVGELVKKQAEGWSYIKP